MSVRKVAARSSGGPRPQAFIGLVIGMKKGLSRNAVKLSRKL